MPERGTSFASFRRIGFALFASIIVSTIWLSTNDRKSASVAESIRLDGIAFKRGPVCSVDDPLISEPIKSFSGTLQLDVGKHAVHASYPFNQVKELLNWGIAVVRVGGTDYSLNSSSSQGEPIGVPAAGAAGAELSVSDEYSGGEVHIKAQLFELPSRRLVVDASWNSEAHGARYCPDYQSFPKEEDQPRKLITQALGLSKVAARIDQGRSQPMNNRVNAVLISRSSGGQSRKMKAEQWIADHPSKDSSLPMHEIFNSNCPGDIGWKGGNQDSNAVRLDMGWPFMVGEKAYHVGRREMYNATCAGTYVFLYSGVARDGVYFLNIEKRVLNDFSQQWSGTVMINDTAIASRDQVVKVESVEEHNDKVIIHAINEDSGLTAVFEAPLITAPKK